MFDHKADLLSQAFIIFLDYSQPKEPFCRFAGGERYYKWFNAQGVYTSLIINYGLVRNASSSSIKLRFIIFLISNERIFLVESVCEIMMILRSWQFYSIRIRTLLSNK